MYFIVRNFYIDNRSVLLVFIAIAALVAILASIAFPWRADLQHLLLDGQTQRPEFTRVAALCGGLATIIGGAFALWRWTIDQRWRRVQYAQQLLDKFFNKPNTKLALRMLDVQGETELPSSEEDKVQTVTLTEEMLEISLRTLEQQQLFNEPYFTIRMIFDEFFTDLSMFQHHIDANLIKPKDIRPYLEYWIKSINGHGRIYSVVLAKQMNKFLVYFDYSAVLKLSRLFGYSLKGL
ncbi:hypothetical protein ACU4GH_16265 [Bradyrhizobium betae]